MIGRNSLFGPVDPAPDAGYADPPARKGFFTDTSVCIGCKACEVACKEWNLVPDIGFEMTGMSYDNSGSLNANSWRHVAFIEQPRNPVELVDWGPDGDPAGGSQDSGGCGNSGGGGGGCGCSDSSGAPEAHGAAGTPAPVMLGDLDKAPVSGEQPEFRWLMESDVCKHCTHAACLDVCPTGSLFRTEFGTVVVQPDICNGCGSCVPACPYGVIERRSGPEGARNVGIAQKCTLCYDRLTVGQKPACAQACPTESILFGDVDELRERANQRVAELHERGIMDARLYGNDPDDGVGGTGAFFLLLDEPEVYGLPPDPVVTTKDLPDMAKKAGLAAVGLLAGAIVSFLGKR